MAIKSRRKNRAEKTNENEIKYIADEYIRNGLIDDFKKLVHLQIEKYPDQEKEMIKHMNTILNNIEGIKNQNLEDYKTHCSMEGHVSQAFARHITSSPYGFSRQGLENKLKLLVYHANKVELTIEDYYNLKYGKNSYIEIVKKIKNILNIKRDIKLIKNYTTDYEVQVCHPLFDSNKLTNQYRERTDMRPI